MFSTWLGISNSNKIGFEDVFIAINNTDKYVIINTLPIDQQSCLIKNTLPCNLEEKRINDLLNGSDYKNKIIVVYGKNSLDNTSEQKVTQLKNLGFFRVFLYTGGLFEWVLLQDVYGIQEFPTTSKTLDILKYKPGPSF